MPAALDIHAYQRFVLQPLIDEPAGRMAALRERFVAERIEPIVARHAASVVDFHRQRGDLIAIITATNRFVTEPIAELLGIEHLIATDPEIVDGAYTGAIAGTPSYREGKITRARDFLAALEAEPEHITFYSDSHNDLPLMRWADRAIAVDPDAELEAAARAGRLARHQPARRAHAADCLRPAAARHLCDRGLNRAARRASRPSRRNKGRARRAAARSWPWRYATPDRSGHRRVRSRRHQPRARYGQRGDIQDIQIGFDDRVDRTAGQQMIVIEIAVAANAVDIADQLADLRPGR